MKKSRILIPLILLIVSTLKAQEWDDPVTASDWAKILHNTGDQNINGNLSIGSTAANSYSKFVIKGPNQPNNSESFRDISFEFSSAGSALIRSYRGGSWDTYLQFLTTSSSGGSPQTRMHIDHIGNVGIGTTSPSERLEIYGGGNLSIKGSSNDAGDIIFKTSSSSQLGRIWTNATGSSGLYLSSGDDNADIIINESGKVGIGTTSTGTHKLAVEGTIGAREIKVEASGWSDFVFYPNYELRTLKEVEEHITEKGHLPEIPSELEVTENGINLGEMNAKLLQKVEELTLYLIEQNKQIQTQQADIATLKTKVLKLEKK